MTPPAMTLIICPGIHSVALSDRFIAALQRQLQAHSPRLEPPRLQPTGLLPTQRYAPFSGFSVWSYLQTVAAPSVPLVLIGFSAGVAGALAAAQLWQAQGRTVAALIAIDGWGVPQLGDFPLHRISHDHFTHWSSALLGAGHDSFYADPPVAHLDLWQAPDRTSGLWLSSHAASPSSPVRTTAIACIAQLLQRYGCGTQLERL
ncbi:MAG: hypothetical protein AAF283_09195 [Cyanobacteria bacterium P01_A01_bin.70]